MADPSEAVVVIVWITTTDEDRNGFFAVLCGSREEFHRPHHPMLSSSAVVIAYDTTTDGECFRIMRWVDGRRLAVIFLHRRGGVGGEKRENWSRANWRKIGVMILDKQRKFCTRILGIDTDFTPVQSVSIPKIRVQNFLSVPKTSA